ncbi:MAG TPA: MSHA biogenesis protein MshD [Cellvibrio sp.]|nr:MSHA biogenesis protein MshD [Cellvibrio sp.]
MHTNFFKYSGKKQFQQGVSLIEMIVFIIVVGIASSALFATYNYSLLHNTDPLIQVRALELAQAKLDEVLALKYDANTPTGGIPACDTPTGVACDNSPDANVNDVDDFHGTSDTPYTGYTRNVTVVAANDLKLITVTVVAPRNLTITLAAYKANF